MPSDQHTTQRRRSLWYAVLIGIGVMAALDEIIFHQMLQWHHFFDRSTPVVGILSDGLLHAAELIAIVAGFFLIADLIRQNALAPKWAWAGFFLGVGGFQIFDGVVNHKVLRVHQVRYEVENLLVYDLVWNLVGVAALLVGFWLFYRARSFETRS